MNRLQDLRPTISGIVCRASTERTSELLDATIPEGVLRVFPAGAAACIKLRALIIQLAASLDMLVCRAVPLHVGRKHRLSKTAREIGQVWQEKLLLLQGGPTVRQYLVENGKHPRR